MAVPDTTTFELQDVVDEVNPTTDDLVDCFADANASYFDSTYEGSKNQLLNFRNYGATSRTMFTIDNSYSYGNASSACTLGTGTTLRNLWHTGSGTYPSVGDTIYQQATGTNNFTPQQFNYIPAGNRAMGINSSGVVTNITLC
mgnify:CR=1 FL=1